MQRRFAKGFTVIELLVAIAIIGVLASVAVPRYRSISNRAKASEGKTNLAAIRTAEEGYFGSYGVYVAAAISPRVVADLSHSSVEWVATPDYQALGWMPEGMVYYSYQVTVGNPADHFTAEAVSDLDADADYNWWGYVKAVEDTNAGIAGSSCQATGVYNPISNTQDRLEIVGPCAAGMGVSIY